MNDIELTKTIEAFIFYYEKEKFQDFCDRLFFELYPDDYTPVRAGGPKGDMKNDGYCPKERIFLQAHATRGEIISKTKKKIQEDLEGCLKHHPDVKKWIYLTNDTLVGEVETFIDELRVKNNTIEIEVWGHKKITQTILKLPKDKISKIIEIDLENDFEILEAKEKADINIIENIFDDVLKRINNQNEYTNDYKMIKIKDKISLNFKSEEDKSEVEKYLKYAILKLELTRKRLSEEDPESQNDIHSHIYYNYNKLKRKGLKNIEILHSLFEYFIPKDKIGFSEYENLTKAFVLSFFEDCTIFEKVKNNQ